MELLNPIKTIFCSSGDKESITDSSQSASMVNWEKGFPSSYSKPLSQNGSLVRRQTFNGIFNYISAAIQYFQKGGLAVYNTVLADKDDYVKGSTLWYYHQTKKTWMLIEATENTKVAPSETNIAQENPWKPYGLLTYIQNKLTIQEDVSVKKTLSVSGKAEIGNDIEFYHDTDKNVDVADGCPTPVEPSHFANKEYVDQKIKNFFISGSSRRKIFTGDKTGSLYPTQATEITSTGTTFEIETNGILILLVTSRQPVGSSELNKSVSLELETDYGYIPLMEWDFNNGAGASFSDSIPVLAGTKVRLSVGSSTESSQISPSVLLQLLSV